MTGKDLFREIGLISEEYIMEAEEVKRSIFVNPMFRKGLATAACLCICGVLYLGIRQLASGGMESASDASTGGQWAEVAMEEESAPEMPIEYSVHNENTGTELQDGAFQEKNDVKMERLEVAEESLQDSVAVTEKKETELDKADELSQTESAIIDDNQALASITQQMGSSKNERDVEAICERFAAYPDSSAELVKEDLVVNLHGNLKSGQEQLATFLADVESHTEAFIELVQYTIEGDPMFYYLHYDGTDFYAVTDYRRDAFGGSGERVHVYYYSYLKVFEEEYEDGTKGYELLLTNEKDLSLEELQSGEYKYLYIMQYSE